MGVSNKKNKKKRKSVIGMFFKTVVSIVLLFVVISGIGLFAYNKIADGGKDKEDVVSKPNTSFIDTLMGKGIELNIAVFGVDKDQTRTDVMFVVHVNSKTKEIGLISVPRDTRIKLSDEVRLGLDSAGRNYNSVCKINAVHAYGGKEEGCKFAVMQLEDLLGIKIDHYARINFDGFSEIVDIIDGVDFEVPQDMYHYDPDPNLNINLKAGMQHLDGSKARQFVRFRSYPQGDVARVKAQQAFLKAVATKILSTETLLKNLPELISTGFEYVDTDITVADAVKYVKYVKDVNLNNIKMETLPGVGQYIGNISYFVHDDVATKEVVNRLFYGKSDEELKADSKTKSIEVSNGGTVQGLAGRTSDMLKEQGFTVSAVTTFKGEHSECTRIIVSEEGMGGDLKSYFKRSQIEVNPGMLNNGIDIMIVLGENEK